MRYLFGNRIDRWLVFAALHGVCAFGQGQASRDAGKVRHISEISEVLQDLSAGSAQFFFQDFQGAST
jgi:hypothetical protein